MCRSSFRFSNKLAVLRPRPAIHALKTLPCRTRSGIHAFLPSHQCKCRRLVRCAAVTTTSSFTTTA